MGCISSKLIIARSMSYHEERNQRSKANSIPLLEDLIISSTASDQYLAALVCTANKLSNELHSKSLSSNTTSKLAIEPESSELIDENLEHSTILEAKKFESDQKNRIWLTKSQIVQKSDYNDDDNDDDSVIKMDLQ
ncbi:hypothetical protein A2U01_0003201, partial [Trifolium medium]|nr:hypothetical protein [Trifolium medium]